MKNDLYFVVNQGCDASTYGLVRIAEEEFPRFKSFIENLNKNSTYGCMPVIYVYKISMDSLREVNYNPTAAPWEADYIDKEDIFYLDDKTYTFAEQYFSYYSECECVISGERN